MLLRLACILAFHCLFAPRLPAGEPASLDDWNVRMEILMVALPESEALALLPELMDSTKIDAAVVKLLQAVKRKKAILTGYPMIMATSGGRSQSRSYMQRHHPTDYNVPTTGESLKRQKTQPRSIKASPESFEVRFLGVSLEGACYVSNDDNDGKWIDVNLNIERTMHLGYDTLDAGRLDGGTIIEVTQPLTFTTGTMTSFRITNGQSALVGTYKLVDPKGHMEVFIAKVVATKAE